MSAVVIVMVSVLLREACIKGVMRCLQQRYDCENRATSRYHTLHNELWGQLKIAKNSVNLELEARVEWQPGHHKSCSLRLHKIKTHYTPKATPRSEKLEQKLQRVHVLQQGHAPVEVAALRVAHQFVKRFEGHRAVYHSRERVPRIQFGRPSLI